MEEYVNKGQAEPFYKTSEELSEAVDDYFKNGVPEKDVMMGRDMVKIPVPTITGLALHLGFCSRQSFYDYEKRPEHSYTIKRARTFIESHYEELLQVGNTTGAIFALKNMGWIDKVNNDHTTNGKDIAPPKIVFKSFNE